MNSFLMQMNKKWIEINNFLNTMNILSNPMNNYFMYF